MSDPVAPKLNPLPFLAGDALLIGVAWLILQNSAKPLGLWQMGALAGCVALGAWCSFIPFLKRYETEAKLVESQNLQTAVAQIQKVETLAEHIQNATAQWQTVQELSSKTNETAQQITRRISEESRAFNEFLQKANDVEKSHLRLEVEKLRRSEGDWLQVLVRIFDHVFALHAAAVHSGQPKLVEQLGGFQNACLDVARRVCAAVNHEPVAASETLALNVTISAGVAEMPVDANSCLSLLNAADKALYAAKARGRNRAVGFDEL